MHREKIQTTYNETQKKNVNNGGNLTGCSLAGIDLIAICTSREATLPDDNFDWLYIIQYEGNPIRFDETPEIVLGQTVFCDCGECQDMGAALSEYYSIYKALNFVEKAFGKQLVELWVGSNDFIHESENELLNIYREQFHCLNLKGLYSELDRLMAVLNVEVFAYTYANKDGITRYF